MSAETFDQHGESNTLVVLDVSVYDPSMSDSLISAGRLMEAVFQNPLWYSHGWLRPGHLSHLRG